MNKIIHLSNMERGLARSKSLLETLALSTTPIKTLWGNGLSVKTLPLL
jgi:hypothetical protein